MLVCILSADLADSASVLSLMWVYSCVIYIIYLTCFVVNGLSLNCICIMEKVANIDGRKSKLMHDFYKFCVAISVKVVFIMLC